MRLSIVIPLLILGVFAMAYMSQIKLPIFDEMVFGSALKFFITVLPLILVIVFVETYDYTINYLKKRGSH